MFTKIIIAGALALPLGLAALTASAATDRAYNPSGSYNPPYDIPVYRAPMHPRMAPMRHAALSCAAARAIVRKDGYRDVTARSCVGGEYTFRAIRHGHAVVLHVNSRNGHVTLA